jgi:hypothetical protein
MRAVTKVKPLIFSVLKWSYCLFFHAVIDVIDVVDDNLSTEKNVAELVVNPDEPCAVNEGKIAANRFGS